MELNYNNLWELLIDRNMKKQDLQQVTGLSKGTVTKLGKNEESRGDILNHFLQI